MEQAYEYSGHLHVHSSFSDGHGTFQEIAEAAAEAGLDFVGITDHRTLGALEQGLEGYYGNVLMLVGTELNTFKNHYIAFGVREMDVFSCDDDPQVVIDAVNARGGFGYLAHPLEKGNPYLMDGRCFPWDRWDVKGYTGMEIWNFGSLWRMAFSRKLQALFWYYLGRYRAGRHPGEEILELWDDLNRERLVIGFAGSDAHAIPASLGPMRLKLFSYQFLFRTLNTHLLLEEKLSQDPEEAREQVYSALRQGNFYIGSDYLHPCRGFRFYAMRDEQSIPMGEDVAFTSPVVLRVSSPCRRGIIRIIKDGRLVYTSNQQNLGFKVLKPGVFRAEIHYRPLVGRSLPWIYSNPIRVTE